MKKFYSLLLLTLFGITFSFAQTIDESFVKPIPYKAAKITVIKELADGKILLGGKIDFYKDKKVNNLIRLNADYSLDETFVFNVDPKLEIRDAKIQSDGKIIVLMDNPTALAADHYPLYQLDSNGEIISSVTDLIMAKAIAIQADDKILVTGGDIGAYGSTSCYLHRYNSDFSIDQTFKNDLAFNASTSAVAVSNNGIYVSGAFTSVGDVAKNSLVKLNFDGNIDTTFDVGQGSNGSGFSMTLLEDGKLLVGGNFFNMKDNVTATSLIRLNSDGTFDSSFSCPYYSHASSEVGLKNSNIYIASSILGNGGMTSGNFLIRLKPDGTLDESFSAVKLNDESANNFTFSFIGEKIVYNSPDYIDNKYGLSVCNLQGNIEDSSNIKSSIYGSFDKGGYFNGKLLIKGDFIKINNVESFGIALLDENGAPDESFIFPSYKNKIKQLQVINDNSVFVGTKTTFINLDNHGQVIKDFDFKLDSELLEIAQFKVLDNGKILITDQWNLVLLNSEGIQESKFNLNSDPNFWITNLRFETQNDKIICAGQFESFGAEYGPKSKLIRFNSDASIDSTFKIDTETDSAISIIKILDSGEIILAGSFVNFNGIAVPNQLVKLSKDGEIDVKFNENLNIPKVGISGGEYYDYRKIEEVDSVVYITQVPSQVTALNLDGTIKSDFEMPDVIDNITDLVGVNAEESSPTSRKTKSVSTTDNFMYAIGTINNNNSGSSSTIVKLNLGKSSGSLSVGPTPQKEISNVQVYPIPVVEKMSLSFSNSIAPTKIAIYSVNGAEVYTADLKNTASPEIDMSKLNSGIYFVKVFSDKGTETKKIIKK